MPRLYLVSTPIGNLGDITYRAVDVLGAVHRILAEDTRRTRILLRHYDIRTPLVSLHAHNEAERSEQVLEWLGAGEELALVSDAGTPLVSDPGARIVRNVIAAGYPVVPVPGASAVLAALAASGMEEPVPFTFFGFVPRSGRARETMLATAAGLDHVAVFYEAPGRLVRLLEDLTARCGAERQVTVARELTKLHEELRRGTLAEVTAYYREHPPRGEIVVVLAGSAAEVLSADMEAAAVEELAGALLSAGAAPSEVAREVSRRYGIRRNQAYQIVQKVASERGGLEA